MYHHQPIYTGSFRVEYADDSLRLDNTMGMAQAAGQIASAATDLVVGGGQVFASISAEAKKDNARYSKLQKQIQAKTKRSKKKRIKRRRKRIEKKARASLAAVHLIEIRLGLRLTPDPFTLKVPERIKVAWEDAQGFNYDEMKVRRDLPQTPLEAEQQAGRFAREEDRIRGLLSSVTGGGGSRTLLYVGAGVVGIGLVALIVSKKSPRGGSNE